MHNTPLTEPLRHLGAGKIKLVGIRTLISLYGLIWTLCSRRFPNAVALLASVSLCVDTVVIGVTLCVDTHQCEMPCERKPMRYGHSEGHTDVTFDDTGK